MPTGVENLDELKQEVAALLESPAFERSKANRALLSYLSEEIFAGRGDQISEYTIAQDLLDRAGTFDPSVDPIVRVRMRRLREAIANFYHQNPGRSVRVTLPRGSYVLGLAPRETVVAVAAAQAEQAAMAVSAEATAAVSEVPGAEAGEGAALGQGGEASTATQSQSAAEDAASGATRSGRARWLFAGAFVGVLAVIAAFVLLWPRPVPQPAPQVGADSYPIVGIAPFRNMTGIPENDVFSKGIPRQIAGDIQNFGRAKVRILSTDLKEEEEGADYVLRGSVLSIAGEVDLAITLVNAQTGEVLMSTRITQDDQGGDYATILQGISRKVSGNITSQGGVISTLSEELFGGGSGESNQRELGVFRCVVLTDRFLVSYDPEQFQEAYRCFEKLGDDVELDASGMASFGTLMMHSVDEFHYMDVSRLPEDMRSSADEVLAYAEALADRYPSQDVSFILLGAVRNAMGSTEAAIQSLKGAVKLNPANPTPYGVLAYAYMSADLYSEAEEAAQKAIRLSADPAPYLYLPLLVSGIVHKNARVVDSARQKYAVQDGPDRDLFLLAAAAMIGDDSEVERISARIEEIDAPLAALRAVIGGEIGRSAVEHFLEIGGLDVPGVTCLSSASGNVSRQMDCAQ